MQKSVFFPLYSNQTVDDRWMLIESRWNISKVQLFEALSLLKSQKGLKKLLEQMNTINSKVIKLV